MARELSQEALLDFLCQAGGRVTNAALLSHFKGFLRDPTATPGLRDRRRELFKGFVNSVAAVRQDSDGTKCVVLRRRYRDLLGEGTGQGAASGPQRRGARPDPTTARDQPGTLSPEISRLQRQHPAPHVQDRPELVTPGTSHPKPRSPESPHLQRQHPAPPTPETPGTTSPETLHLQSQHPAPPVRNRPEPVTSRTLRQSPETLHLQRHHPFPSVRDRPEPLTLGTSRAETPHLQWDRSAPRARDRSELEIQSYLYPEIAHPHLQRTREWVARHHQMPEPAGQNPVRAWSVLPDDFLQLHSKPGLSVRETAQAESSLFSQGFLPGVPTQSSESWLEKPSPKVFRSIRCQLSLKDMEDFVDQESHSSEESSSEPTESPAGSGEGLQAARGAQDSGEPENPTWVLSAFPKKTTASQTPQDLRRGNHPCTKASGGAEEPLPLPPPRPRRSFRRSPQAGRAAQSSSDEECLDEDSLKRTRRPPRPRKPSKAGPVPSPRVNATLTPKPAGTKAVVAVPGRSHSWWDPTGEGLAALVPHRPFEHKSSLVPLEPREHKWIVKLARGSWIQVLALFWEDPQLALHRDFLTGYTALHWIAKHGSLDALQDLVSGAQKAGIVLDVNVRSSCGYTPLHLAAMHGHQGIIKLLVQRLASRVNVRDSSGKKPWQYLASNTSGEIWQLLGAPRGKPIFPVQPIVSPTRKTKRHITRKTSLAALLKSQHNKWKLANHHEKFPTPREQEENTD